MGVQSWWRFRRYFVPPFTLLACGAPDAHQGFVERVAKTFFASNACCKDLCFGAKAGALWGAAEAMLADRHFQRGFRLLLHHGIRE
eukprot:3080320-Lingulodinium_polyedra.AAC.1